MSKGSAGKVYFVLYLAVILELLIIIVERDEAEESLHKRQKESMRIVQNILSQLQTGSGSSDMNVSPNDLIIIQDKATIEALPKDQRIKRQKTYSVKVSVTDVTGLKRLTAAEEEEKGEDFSLTKLGNVEELVYQLFYYEVRKDEIQETAPLMPAEEEFRKKFNKRINELKKGEVVTNNENKAWTLLDSRKLNLKLKETKDYNKADTLGGWRKPIYSLSVNDVVSGDVLPDVQPKDTIFFYDNKRTEEDMTKGNGSLKARTFTVNFDPGEDAKPGWYKLRFFSSTNKILGVDGGLKRDITDEDQINVGVVKLKVKALKAVRQELMKELDGKIELRDQWYDGQGGVLEMAKALDEFNKAIKDGKDTFEGAIKLSKDETANKENEEILNKITLYDYIIKLLTPGFSAFLDQNRGNMDIDVEVRKPDAQQAPPQISDLAPKVIIFDKLQVTKIPFTVRPALYFKPGSSPMLEIKPETPGGASLTGQWRIEEAKTQLVDAGGVPGAPVTNLPKKLFIVFDKPVPAGDYRLKLSYAGGGKVDTTSALLKVLPSQLDAKSMKNLVALKYSYGKRLSLKSKLLADAEMPLQQFFIDYTLGNERTVADNPYTEGYTGPYIPASAKKVKIQVVWKYPETNERVPLFQKELEPDQQPPDINASSAIAEMKSSGAVKPKPSKSKKPVAPDNFQISIKGIAVDFEVPIDADNKDPNNSKPLKATLDNVEAVGDAEVIYNETQLHIYNGDEPDPTSTWQPNGTTFSVLSGAYSDGTFPITIQVKDLPAKIATEPRTLRGTVVIKVQAKIVNKKAGRYSVVGGGTVTIPINIPYQ